MGVPEGTHAAQPLAPKHTANPERGFDLTALAALPPEALLTKAEAAAYLGVTMRWMRRAVERRLFEVARPGGKLIRIRKAALDAYLSQASTPAGDDQGVA
jgi:excisionase family DNA binding protein